MNISEPADDFGVSHSINPTASCGQTMMRAKLFNFFFFIFKKFVYFYILFCSHANEREEKKNSSKDSKDFSNSMTHGCGPVPFFYFLFLTAAAAAAAGGRRLFADNEEPITDEFCITSTKKKLLTLGMQ